MLVYPSGWASSTRKQVVVAVHGHGTGPTIYAPADPPSNTPGYPAWVLAAIGGFAVLSIDADGPVPWGDPTELSRISDAVSYAKNTLGSTSAKVGYMGYSMGGLAGWNALASGTLNSTNCAGMWLWEPCSDLRWAALAYTPPYSLACQASQYNGNTTGPVTGTSTYASEIKADYPSGYSASDPMQVAAVGGLTGKGVPVHVTATVDDNVVPPAQITSIVSRINDPNVQLVTPQTRGGHSNAWGSAGVPRSTYVSFFQGLSW
jgi:dienelactone hydrolase